MQDNGYRIIKLVSGETLVGKIVKSTNSSVIKVEDPFEYKIMVVVDPKSLQTKDIITFRDWTEFSTFRTVDISITAVISLMIPSEVLNSFYDDEKTRIKKQNTETIEDMVKSLENKPPKTKDTVSVHFELTPDMAEDLLDYMHEMGDLYEDDEDMEDDVEPSKPKKKKSPKKNDPKKHGNGWKDWSDDPKDYM